MVEKLASEESTETLFTSISVSIQSILKDALERNIFYKYENKKDKRIKNFYLTKSYYDLINKWIQQEGSHFLNGTKD